MPTSTTARMFAIPAIAPECSVRFENVCRPDRQAALATEIRPYLLEMAAVLRRMML
jgi:hypothetical protein